MFTKMFCFKKLLWTLRILFWQPFRFLFFSECWDIFLKKNLIFFSNSVEAPMLGILEILLGSFQEPYRELTRLWKVIQEFQEAGIQENRKIHTHVRTTHLLLRRLILFYFAKPSLKISEANWVNLNVAVTFAFDIA